MLINNSSLGVRKVRFAAEEHQADMEVARVACASDGVALQFTAPALREQRELVLLAVRHHGC